MSYSATANDKSVVEDAQFRAAFELAAVAQAQIDPAAGQFLRVNAALCALTGYSEAELLDLTFSELSHPEDRQRDLLEFEKMARGEAPSYRLETRYIRKDGAVIWAETSAVLIRTADGRPWRSCAFIQDVTRRKQAEDSLRRQFHVTETIAKRAAEALILMDAQNRVTFINPAGEQMFGWRAEELLGKSFHDVLHYQTPDGTPFPISDCPIVSGMLSGEGVHKHQDVFFRRDGQAVFVRCSNAPVFEDGRLIGAVLVVSDITEQKRHERQVREQARLLDLSNDGIIVRDVNDRITSWNKGAEQIYGWQRSEVLGKISHELLKTNFPLPLPEIREALHRHNRWEAELVHTRRDGARIITLSRWVLAPDDEGRPTAVLETNTDITQRKEAEQALRQQLELNATVTSNSTQAILMMDFTGYCTFMNPAAERMFGFTFDEIRGRPLHEMIHHHHPDGTPYPMSDCPIDRALPENFDIREHEDIFIRKSGDFFPVLVAASPIFKDGKPVSTVIEVRDITQRKQADQALAEAQEQLQRHAIHLEQVVAQRTAKLAQAVVDLEAFSYSVSHDLRAPLRAMQGFAQILQEDFGSKLDGEALDYIGRIEAAPTRMDQLIHDILAYSHVLREDLPLVPVDLDTLIRGVVESYPHLSQAEISFKGPLPSVLAHQAALTQCVSNLLGNAVKFVVPGVRPRVQVRADVAGEKVRLWIEDNGIGIAREQQERIFQMHQRLNPNFEGTGIGLAIVRRAVERMGGSVGVESEAGEGSRFWLDLKRA